MNMEAARMLHANSFDSILNSTEWEDLTPNQVDVYWRRAQVIIEAARGTQDERPAIKWRLKITKASQQRFKDQPAQFREVGSLAELDALLMGINGSVVLSPNDNGTVDLTIYDDYLES